MDSSGDDGRSIQNAVDPRETSFPRTPTILQIFTSSKARLNMSSSSSSSSEHCSICSEPLLIPFEANGGEDQSPGPSVQPEGQIIDDVKVNCGNAHHFHWECLIEHVQAGGDQGLCPAQGCGRSTLNEHGLFLVDVRNEGGLTEGFDMGHELVSAI
jgi:hypothetical protein